MKTLLAATAFAVALSSSVFAGQSGRNGAGFNDWIAGVNAEKNSTPACFRFQTSLDQASDGPDGTPAVNFHVMTLQSAGFSLEEFNQKKALLTIAFLNRPAHQNFVLTGRTVCGAIEVYSNFTGFGS